MNRDDWMDELDEIIALNSPVAAPPNSYTIVQYIERVKKNTGIKLSRPTARKRLRDLVEQGMLDTKLAYVDRREKRVFWLVNPAGNSTTA